MQLYLCDYFVKEGKNTGVSVNANEDDLLTHLSNKVVIYLYFSPATA